jgi:tetrapyrrole methylase family protein / MazG family protein
MRNRIKKDAFDKIAPAMKSFQKLLKVMSRLRSRTGCPWDRKQTHESLLKYLFEEAQEFKQSVRKKDYPNMEEELGDLLLQVVFHAQLAKEKRRFTMDNIIQTLIRKLTLRHPHVFGFKPEHKKLLKGRSLRTSQDVLDNWDLLKKISSRR